MTYTVYAHTSPSQKVYIGITCLKIAKRWGNGGIGYKQCPHFWNAIVKYGWDGITHQIIADGLTEEEAKQSEKDLIIAYKTRDPLFGYNLTDGGDGVCGYHHSEEACAKISEAMKSRVVSDETREAISAAKKGKGMGNQRGLGYKHTEEALAKIGAASMGNQHNIGYKHTYEARANMSASRMGHKTTDETKAKISASLMDRNRGITTSINLQETKGVTG